MSEINYQALRGAAEAIKSDRIFVSHSVYRVDDTDIPANFCLGNRENN